MIWLKKGAIIRNTLYLQNCIWNHGIAPKLKIKSLLLYSKSLTFDEPNKINVINLNKLEIQLIQRIISEN